MPNCLDCEYCHKHQEQMQESWRRAIYSYTCTKKYITSVRFGGLETLNLYFDCVLFEDKLHSPSSKCPTCERVQDHEDQCSSCLDKIKQAQEVLARLNRPKSRSKPKPVMGERKIQVKDNG